MFRHPKYYKELRKRALDERNSELHVRPISGSEACDTDQAISPMSDGSPRRRASDPGLKLQAIEETVPHCDIEEASSAKLQAPSESNNKPQASSDKQQASSSKPQASSSKI